QPEDALQALRVTRVAGVEASVAFQHPLVSRPIDIVDGHAHRWNAAGDEHTRQAFRAGRQIAERAEPAEALSEQEPGPITAQVTADRFGVADDGIRPELRQVVGLSGGVTLPGEGVRVHAGAAGGAALIEQQHTEPLHRTADPAGPADGPG